MGFLSVIIIGKNEASHISRCIRSVLRGTAQFKDCEIIYVDSASSDNTIQIAKKFPIRIIQLRSFWPLSSAAGRYLGYVNTSGKYVFFIDGDTIVYKNWLQEGISFLESNPKIGGVAGTVNEIFLDKNDRRIGMIKNRYNQKENVIAVKVFGGIALYRRAVLEDVHPFNPYVVATPELELSLRIRKGGYRLIRLLTSMAITYGPERETFNEILRRARSNLYSMGSTLRYCQENGLFWNYIRERMGFILYFAFGSCLSMGLLLYFLLVWNTHLILLWMLCMVLFLAFLSFRKRSILKVIISAFKRTIILFKTIESFVTSKTNKSENYPTDVIIIK